MTGNRFAFLSAVHVFLIQDGRVLLLRRFNTGYEDGNYSVVAGHLDGDEEVKRAAIREAREEVAIEIAPEDIDVVGVMHRRSNDERIDFFLATRRWRGEAMNGEPEKCDQLFWADLDRLPANVVPYVRRALDNYRRGAWFDSFGWLDGDHARTPSDASEGSTMPAGNRTAAEGAYRENASMVNVGEKAPDFTLRGASGNEVTLSDLRGAKRALLMFYPADGTSG